MVIVILQVIPNLSPVSPWTSVLPLVFVLSVTALKEAIEDASRHRSDRELNHKKARFDGVGGGGARFCFDRRVARATATERKK